MNNNNNSYYFYFYNYFTKPVIKFCKPVKAHRLKNEKSFLMLALEFLSSSSVASMLMNWPSVSRCASDTNSLLCWHSRCTSISRRPIADFCHQQITHIVNIKKNNKQQSKWANCRKVQKWSFRAQKMIKDSSRWPQFLAEYVFFISAIY